jgi:uncharacterized surface protein with fasciclin (FAS1) repeats
MRYTKHLVFSALLLLLLMGCVEEKSFDKFERPDWLAGKVYTQISDTIIFEKFSQCLELTGYDTIINRSGSYTVFAPNNDAFDLYFTNHPSYNSIEDIPLDELSRIVKYHIVQNPWSKDQLMSLDVWGWIDPLDENNDEPRGYKRETLLLEDNLKYGVRLEDKEITIVDTLGSPWYRRAITDSRKFAPLFFEDYFTIYDLSSEDYNFYFNRTIEDSKALYFVDAKIIGDEIFAENGFVYNIDKVVEPLKNTYEIISNPSGDVSYSRFLDMINRFPSFRYNEQETNDQIGADLGNVVDSLFDLTFPELAFNITREKTKAPPGSVGLPGNVTIRYHHGMVAPSNEAIELFENEYFSGGDNWPGLKSAPTNLWKIIANTHLSVNPIYKTDIEKGFYNGELDQVTVDESTIIQKEYGSNGTFLGVNKVIVPRALSSITGPIYLRRGFNNVMLAIEESGLLSALKREREFGDKYMFFVESDQSSSIDSSFLYDNAKEEFIAFQVGEGSIQKVRITKNDLRTLILNHVAIRQATGFPRKEFIPNLAGNYLTIDNEKGAVFGTAATTVGYNGSTMTESLFTQISTNADNGNTYEVDDWLSFAATSLYIRLKTLFPEFHDLIVSAGLAKTQSNKFTFVSESENYTIFAPSAQALIDAQVDTLSIQELQDFVKLHFIRKTMLFTDGFMPSGYYETLRTDEQSNEFNKIFTKIYIDTDNLNEISFNNQLGEIYHTIIESDSTNYLVGETLNDGAGTFPGYLNNGVIHKIDVALNINEID